MLDVYEIIFLIALQFMVVKCLLPDLSVQMLDKRLIQRKRQDTLDMCRLFTAETEKMNHLTETNRQNAMQSTNNRRAKRDTGVTPTSGDVGNAKRVENIVDKLYEDLEENGVRVTYRQMKVDSLTTAPDKDVSNKTMRRFNFAPAELLGPLPTPHSRIPDGDGAQPRPDWAKRWKHGIVPYFIDSNTYDTQLAEVIMKAFDYFEKATCIRLQRLRDRPTDKDSLQKVEWLYITNPSGIRQCVHSNERKANKGVQMVIFGYDCMSLGEIVHEVMHILGFSHEHNRPDRDQHITILWNNIKPGYKKYFELRTEDSLLNIPYDHGSVLHYPPRAFSKNGQLTITSQPGVRLGQREGLSDGDVEKVGIIYGHECVDRNREYLLKTCPSVVRVPLTTQNVTQQEIEDYFKNRLWPYGVVNYKIRDLLEFSAEERENIKAVIRHIQRETCIEFKDISAENEADAAYTHDPDEKNTEKAETTDVPDQQEGDEVSEVTIQQSDAENEINVKEDSQAAELDAEKPELEQDTRKHLSKPSVQKESNNTPANTLRRHASDILILARSTEPGCACPTPGKPGGEKVLYINADCFNSVNDLLHLFVHLLGLDHQHNMHDRDSYLHILWDNLSPDVKEEMKKKLPPAASLDFDYDYQSVMHYPWLQIKNGVTNIMYPIWNDGWAMGHWQGLSSTDVAKLNKLYYNECMERVKQSAVQ